MGSHIDSVPNGGNFDGILGVLGAIEVINTMNDNDFKNRNPIEVVAFMCEESSRFGTAVLGSKAMCGKLDCDTLKKLVDDDGKSLYTILKMRGLNADKIADCTYTEDLKAFLELHIEQGRVLEDLGCAIGIVTGISGPTRLNVSIKGSADHSGATPMELRHDALCAAAEIILLVEETAQIISEEDEPVVGTVGTISSKPGAINVIPGEAHLKIDIRSISLDAKIKAVRTIQHQIEAIALERDVEIKIETTVNENPVALDSGLIAKLEDICKELGYASMQMPSGAGHDAMQWASTAPTALIFVPCENGLSHCPEEWAEIEDMAKGVEVLYKAVCELTE
jgi:hydantoinase/carbamoylase family amidase